MTDELKAKVVDLHERGYTPSRIARMLDVHVYSVRWVLNHGVMLKRAEKKRRAKGAVEYKCSKCHELGHNRRTCTK